MSDLGSKLRKARIEKGYTLNTLQQMTKIQKKYLQAIEEGNYEAMPGSFYVRAFIKQYADVVGLNGDELLLEYEADSLDDEEETPLVQDGQDDLPSRLKRNNSAEKSTFEVLLSYAPIAGLVLIIILIMAMLLMAIQQISRSENKEVAQESQITTTAVSVLSPESASEVSDEEVASQGTSVVSSNTNLAENQIQVGNQTLTIQTSESGESIYLMDGNPEDYEFEVKGNSFAWVGVFEDDRIVQDTTISADDSVKHKPSAGVRQVQIRLGYPEGGQVYVNGVEVKALNPYTAEIFTFQKEDASNPTDNPASQETIALDVPTDESQVEAVDQETQTEQAATSYEGPAVLAP
ncbi:helix-turn-helix domain-containing protein [Hutsoniella sourekii]|uniref:helix-turn-helix domain-containing protein n=1 Tax=Hutsoniella sourekii TaxID=87650 RepID=UPI0004BBA722|nr:helix-turn-helix domain-containing protein [Hutsoniella sourekii]